MTDTTTSTDTTSSTTSTTSTTSTDYTYSSSDSDIDWDALIESMVAAYESKADTIESKIEDNETTIAAYEEMQSLLQDIIDAADALRGTDSSLTANDDAFSLREAYLTSNGDVDAESAIVVTADGDANIDTYDVQILQLATTEKVSSNEYEDSSSELGLSGTFSIQLDGYESADIDVTEDMSLADIADEINELSDTTGVQASVLQVDDDTYELILTGTDTGEAISMVAVSGDDIAQSLGLSDDTVTSDDFEDSSTALGYTGTLTVQLDGGDSADIDVTEDMSLADVADAINAQTDTTGVTASVVESTDDDGNTTYSLSLTSDTDGGSIELTSVTTTTTDEDDNETTTDDIVDALGLTATFTNVLQEEQGSIMTIDGVTITRDSNTIDDAIDGITFQLYQETGEDASISVEISNDLSSIESEIVDLVDAYNAYREWAITQQEVSSDGTASDDATLFGDSLLRSANSVISDALSTMFDDTSMALLGLSYDENNYLELDEDTLDDALLNDLDAVEDLLMFTSTSTSDDVAVLSRNSSMPSELTIEITCDDDGDMTSVTVNGEEGLFEVDGSRIIGVDGTEYEGITLVFTGTESQTVSMTFSMGIIEQLYTGLDDYADDDDGYLQTAIDNLSDTNDDLQDEYDEIISNGEDYEERLTEKYADYQSSIEEAESTISYLEVLLSYGDDD